ncbi:sugar ABC transporter ATP-binding protein [Vagococcus fluvialis]|uniref:sugar ABC transporter ATP-binding protein n=1 Tax=Vagococcus fluvialis TaxID=2738 RepID=UPI003B58FC1E
MVKLEMKNISIEFPGVKALDDVEFFAQSARVHALIGANGAGKSTLMKVLAGSYDHYTGEILINGKSCTIKSPRHAQNVGVQIVYQEVDTALIPYLTVAENILLNELVLVKEKNRIIRWKDIYQRAQLILDDLNLTIDSKKLVSELSLAEKQMVLIARAVSFKCQYLILDEPTAPLSNSETKELFRIVNELKKKDVSIIFISHRLPELFDICDDITVMRDGQFVARKLISETNQEEIVELMLGRQMGDQFPKESIEHGDTLFEVKNLSDGRLLEGINMTVKSGEIVGISGLVGAGKTELCKTLFGEFKPVTGEMFLAGKKIKNKNPYVAVKNRIAFVPEERRKEGILVEETITSNASIVNLGKFSYLKTFLNLKKEKHNAQEVVDQLAVKAPSVQAKVKNLSGGNQQKVAIGKWLTVDSEIYIFDEPTKGVDVGAKKDIFELIVKLAAEGKGIIYATCEFPEILGLTDRSYVMYDGKIVKEVVTSQVTEEELLYYSTGGN